MREEESCRFMRVKFRRGHHSPRLATVPLVLTMCVSIALLATVACTSASAPAAQAPRQPCALSGAAVIVSTSDSLKISPQTVTITAGQFICWQNLGSQTHDLIDNNTNGARIRGTLPAGQSYVQTFGFSTNIVYRCLIHANMTGSVIVN